MSMRGVAGFAAAAVFWAACLVGLAFAAGSLGVALTVALLGLCGAVGLLIQATLVKRKLTWRVNWSSVVIWAALGAVIVWAITFAVSWAGVAVGALTVSSIPLFHNVVAQMRGKSPATGLGAVSLLLGIGGLARQFTERLQHPVAVESSILSGAIGGFVSLLMIPVAPPVNPSLAGFAAVVAIALGGGFVMLFAMSHAADSVPRRPLAILPGVGTVLSVIAGVVILGERLSVPQVLGLVLILAGSGLLLGLVPRWFPASWRA
ncbi:MAG: hypothetical protein CVT62_00835 [Actinobacteria bacterium HGW-Actinobacteria-2]|nr:MAG: hypothetical protein CVT62_00835 [Actinobacteria bacterium HGW-Actinobacteria-2]